MIKLIKSDKSLKINLPFFAKEVYLKSKTNNYGWFVSDNFILPFTIFENFFFKRLVFTTSTISKNKSLVTDELNFLNNVIQYIKKNHICDYIFKPQPSVIFRIYPNGTEAFRWGTHIINIENSLENMINKVSKSQRNYIRKAIRDGVEIEETTNYNEIYHLANETLKRQKIQLGINKEEFINQFKEFYPNNAVMFKATFENIIQGTLIVFFDKEHAYAEYAGSIPKPKNGSLKLLHLKAMEYLSNVHNIKTYNFIGAIPDIIEGSKEAGIQKFKKEFGATIKEGYQFRAIINPLKYFIFNNLLKIYFKLKRIDYEDPVEKYKKLSKSNLKI